MSEFGNLTNKPVPSDAVKEENSAMSYTEGSETEPCPNCKETVQPCACMRNKCHQCGNPVGNITFTVCDDCWDKMYSSKPVPSEQENQEELMTEIKSAIKTTVKQMYDNVPSVQSNAYNLWLEIRNRLERIKELIEPVNDNRP